MPPAEAFTFGQRATTLAARPVGVAKADGAAFAASHCVPTPSDAFRAAPSVRVCYALAAKATTAMPIGPARASQR